MTGKNLITVIAAAIFFSAMMVLTFSARTIHRSFLPDVETERFEMRKFPWEYTDENGEPRIGTKTVRAIESSKLDKDFYTLYKKEKNGEMRDYVKRTELRTGSEYDGYTEITSLVGSIVIDYAGELYDDCEVNVIQQ